ncbi:hypothetical protein TanjilG_16751 [Lupinus angustifolius]|uniref:SOSEKI DIX-like domain-containing protein n=1 Tax=Lupinus angustifolius TaxID=3871 RepID=A0A4P1R0F0_LUPAN|nr:PREDICTED: protein UPSTREAM OF FLC [Lupinus angustifolius]OIV98424.1 hypothetical protein TanjilG_16751 [Lupinus angustifolius]
MDVHTHRVRDNSPNRGKICRIQKKVKPAKKVQVVYYLSRNGLLEHPHYVEIKLLANEPLRLKDVFDRLIALRGSGMPLQYSWSCKRNYKSGYVWYDLALNDIIHSAEGAEYVLKGSELVEGCSERFQQLQVGNKQTIHQQQEGHYNYNSKGKAFNSSPHTQREGEEYEDFEEQEEEYEDGEKTSYTSSTTTPHSRCSRGVSTDEILVLDEDQDTTKTKPHDALKIKDQNKTTTSDKEETTATLAEKLNQEAQITNGRNTHSKRFEEESESGSRSGASRNSVLLQLIACGSSGVDAKNEPRRVSNVGTTNRIDKCVERTEKKVLCEAEMINYVSENPRFGNLVSEEKEYFSGSLVESIKANRVGSQIEPVLKRSNSYNEERRSKLGMEEVKVKGMEEEKRETKVGVKGKCIPRKKSSKDNKK